MTIEWQVGQVHQGLHGNKTVTYISTLSYHIFEYFGCANSFAWSIETNLWMIEDVQMHYFYFVALNLFIIGIRSFFFYCVEADEGLRVAIELISSILVASLVIVGSVVLGVRNLTRRW